MKKIKIILKLLLLVLLVQSCGSENANYAEKMVFRYNESAGISSLDPAFSRNLENIWACNQLYNGLVEMDDSLSVSAAIAKNWNVGDSGKTYTFTLRNDVYFHDNAAFPNGKGRRVVAADFLYSFNRIRSEELASPGMWVFGFVAEGEEGFSAPNDSTFIIRLHKEFPPFLGILTMKYCSVVPFEAVEEYKEDFRSNPVGTGPFRFNFWYENSRLVFLKNENYYEEDAAGNSLPYIDAVSISFVRDKSAAFLDLVKGNYDFMSGLHNSYKDELLTQNGDLNPLYADKLYLQKQPSLKTDYLGILVDENQPVTKNSPILIKEVRQAFNYAINRRAMVKYLRNNIFYPAENGFVPYGMPSYKYARNIGYTYNPKKAAKLLSEAGFPGGKDFPEITISTTSDYVDLCEFVQHQLSEIGIKIKVDVLPASVHGEYVANGELSFFRKSWLADYPDEENFLALFYSENEAPAGPNYTRFKNKQYDHWYQQALQMNNPVERSKMYAKMDSLVMTYAPVIPLYYDVMLRFVSHDVSGLDNNPMNLLDLRRVQIKK